MDNEFIRTDVADEASDFLPTPDEDSRPAEIQPELMGETLPENAPPPEGDGKVSALSAAQALSILESNPLGIYVLDEQWRFQYMNPEVSDILGRPREGLLGKNIWDELHSIIGTAFYTNYRRAVDSQQPREFEAEVARLGKWFHVSAYPYKGGLTVYFRDITERKQVEREQALINLLVKNLQDVTHKAEMLQVTLKQVCATLNVHNAALALVNFSTDELIIEDGCGLGEERIGTVVPAEKGVTAQVVDDEKTYSHYDAFTDPNFPNWRDMPENVRALACAPLVAHEKAIGAIWAEREDEFTSGEIHLLELICRLAANHIHRAAAVELAEQRVSQYAELQTVDKALSLSQNRASTFDLILNQAYTLAQADAADILLLANNRGILECAAGRGFRFESLAQARIRANEGHAGQVMERGEIVCIPNLGHQHDSKARSKQLEGEDFITYCGAPLVTRGRVAGVLEVFYRRAHPISAEQRELLETLARHGAAVIDSTQLQEELIKKSSELDAAVDSIIEAWVHALDLRDQETADHTKRVVAMTVKLAEEFGYQEPALTHIRRGALLHDIGKTVILDNILRKPTSLTEEEWEVMYKHPSYGYGLLSAVPLLRAARDIPYCHHERWDGSGYPRKLRGDEIPLPARIFAVVDTWDALTSDRPYRKAWPKTRARAQILEESNWHFDPQVVDVFMRLVEGEM